jgi:hypothetical protein
MYYVKVFDNTYWRERKVLKEGNDFIAKSTLELSEFLESTSHDKYVLTKV